MIPSGATLLVRPGARPAVRHNSCAMLIRAARELDRPALRDLDRRAWSLVNNPILPDGRMWMDPELDLVDVLVVEREGNLAGYVQLGRAMPAHLSTAAHAGRIRSIAVAPEH